MNFSRKTILVVGAALLAACGDKVTVSEYTPPAATSKVNSVEVAPATATLNIGQTITLTAAVNADAGLATTVTWTASAANVTVSSAGVVTAVSATPGVAVCATSTVDTGKKGCATIVVAPTAPVVPASISINSITTNTVGTTVNPANVAGTIDVTLNVNPGNQTVSKIVLLVGGIRQDSQTFTAAQSAALRFAADEAVAAQTTFPQVVFSVNTATYNTTTGVVRWANGTKAVSAQLYTTQGGATTAATATAQTNLTFNNVDGYYVTTTGGNTAVDAAGYRWTGNSALTVNALPVMYSGTAIGTVTAAIVANTAVGSTCAAGAGAAANATALTGSVYAITIAKATSPAGCGAAFPNMITITSTNAAGDNMTLTTNGLVNTYTGIRWDNTAPPVPAFAANPNGRTGGWINDAVSFNTIVGASNLDGWLAAAVVDANVGGTITYTAKAAAGATAALAAAGSAMTTAASLAPSATAATYCAIINAADVLGNTTTTPAGACAATTQTIAFGVDRYAPLVSFTAGIANNTSTNAFAVGTYTMSVTDTGVIGNSQFGAVAANVIGSSIRRIAAGTSTTITTAGTGAYPAVTVDISAQVTAGYYTTSVSAKDQAGNSTVTAAPRVALLDAAAPAAIVPTQTTVAITPGTATTFNSIVSDAMDLWQTYWTLPYGATATIETAKAYFAGNAGAYNAATLVNGNQNVSVTIPSFTDAITTIGAGWAVGTVSADSATFTAAPTALTSVNVVAMDFNMNQLAGYPSSAQAVGVANVPAAAGFAPSGVTASAVWGAAGAALTTNVANTSTATHIYLASSGDATSLNTLSRLGTTAATATSTTFNLIAKGAFGAAAPVFTRIEYYGQCSSTSAANFVLLGAAASATISSQVDNGLVRTWTYPGVSFAPGTNGCGGNRAGINFFAIMYKADGAALITPVKLITLVS